MSEASLKRVILKEAPFAGYLKTLHTPLDQCVGEWPGRWLSFPSREGFALYRLAVHLEAPIQTRIHVSADQGYELYIDGSLEGMGSERGDASNWYFDSYDLLLPAGWTRLLARVWALGDAAGPAQLSVRPGFLLVAEESGELLSTGQAKWEVQQQSGITWTPAGDGVVGAGPAVHIDSRKLDPDWRSGKTGAWTRSALGEMPIAAGSSFVRPDRHYLTPALLRPPVSGNWPHAAMRFSAKVPSLAACELPLDERTNERNVMFALATTLKGGAPMVIAPKTNIRAIIDLNEYLCFHPQIDFARGQGALVRLRYAESLWNSADEKGTDQRDQIAGKLFWGVADELKADGREHRIQIPWWRSGRFVQLEIKTAREALELQRIGFDQTRSEMGEEFRLQSNIPGLDAVARCAVRTVQMCAHQTYLDSPALQQLQRVDDARIQMLISYLLQMDSRLARKALLMFESSRRNASGFVLEAWPGPGTIVPPFSVWWIAMIADYARWRDDIELVRRLLPGGREVMERILSSLDAQNLLISPRGWNYVDTADGFEHGVPPGGEAGGRSGVLQWLTIYGLTQLAEVEEQNGISAMARHWKELATTLTEAAEKHYFDRGRQMYADDLEHRTYSQHAQALAGLSRTIKRDRAKQVLWRSLQEKDVIACSLRFSHYLLEAAGLWDEGKLLRQRMADWQQMIERGYTTFPDSMTSPRCDCYGTSGHVLYHILTTLAGIRPGETGMKQVLLEPRLQVGEQVAVSVAHPRGMMHLELRMTQDGLEGRGNVPRGVKVSGGGRAVAIRQTAIG